MSTKVKVLGCILAACMLLGGCNILRSDEVETTNAATSNSNAADVGNDADGEEIILLLTRAISTEQDQEVRVVGVNLESGEVTTHFFATIELSPFGDYYKAPATQCSHSWKELVSPDLQKFAITKHLSNGHYHAGWIDADGKFFDVIERLSLSQGYDYDAVGFTKDGEFVFADDVSATGDVTYYCVSLDNFSNSAVGTIGKSNEFFFHETTVKGRTLLVTDLDGGDRYLADCYNTNNAHTVCIALGDWSDSSLQLLDITNSWSGHFSPDGERVAILTAERASTTKLRVLELGDNGEFTAENMRNDMVNIEHLPPISNKHDGSIFRSYNADDPAYFGTIIDWR